MILKELIQFSFRGIGEDEAGFAQVATIADDGTLEIADVKFERLGLVHAILGR